MTYIVLQTGRQRAGAGGAGTRTKLARSQRAEAPFNEKEQAKPPRAGGRCGEERGAVPAAGAAAHRPVSAAEAARLRPSPRHTNACVRAAWAPGRALRSGSAATAAAERGWMHPGPGVGRGGRGERGCLGGSWSASDGGLEDEVYDEDGNTLQDFAYDQEPLGIANPSSVIGEMYTLYYPPEKRHADGIFNKAYRKLLGQLSARKYLHSLMAKRVGGASGGLGDDAEPLTKRHIDGIFTDSYSRYRKQMAVKKYLAAVLGKRYKQRIKNKGRRVAYL
ncbi:pituitary adenylate cyclase-activating polypeptide isoform X1 [Zonotrichia albicollis]|uniref:pituitary adenylate cyclase-activating polypeptide isoform X1 n=1 Tax=Zonotrichia albicollis TaxID=44394 RepID=UPI003D80F067